jgi:hypothetical protein
MVYGAAEVTAAVKTRRESPLKHIEKYSRYKQTKEGKV